MIFLQPVWILLIVPLGAFLFSHRLSSRVLNLLRAVAFLLLVLALCRPALRWPGRAGHVVVVADRSYSMPPQSQSEQKQMVDLLQSARRHRNRLAVVSFGRRSAIEQPPQFGEFRGFIHDVGQDQSNLAEGLHQALALIPPKGVGRILVLSDGRWTGRDPAEAAVQASSRRIPIDYRLQQRLAANDVAVHRILAPRTVMPGESYIVTAWVYSPTAQSVPYRFARGESTLAAGHADLDAGSTRLAFRDTARDPGTRRYTLDITAPEGDQVPENNTAAVLVGVQGARPVLCVSPGETSGLADLLQAGGVEIRRRQAENVRWSLEELSDVSAVILENVPAGKIGNAGMESIAAWVTQSGGGLMITGGQRSYGPGGYFRSPLDAIMPVSMELRKEHRKFSVAIAIALDRSGSMAMSAGGGKTKMDLANVGSVQVLDMLSDMDELGVIAVDSSPHTIVELKPVEENRAYRDKILRIESMGGGIFIYEALSAAAKMLVRSESASRHIILFADAADSEEPGDYRTLLTRCRDSGISVSVVALGTAQDTDAGLLRDIARLGEGECFFTRDPEELPRLFAQDALTLTRSAFVEEATATRFTAGYTLLGAILPTTAPTVGGYNLCYMKPDANPALLSVDSFQAPILASWQAGNGRVLCYTGEADGRFSGPMAEWPEAGNFFATLARWTAGASSELPDGMLLVQKVEKDVCRLELHLDPDRSGEPFSGTPTVHILRGAGGSTPDSETRPMDRETADLFGADVVLSGQETLLASVKLPGRNPLTLTPVCLPYSQEFARLEETRGRAALESLARTTGGEERLDLADIWKKLPTQPRFVDISPVFILLAVLVFLLDILERRTGLLSSVRRRRVAPPPESPPKPAPERRHAPSAKASLAPPAQAPPERSPAQPAAPAADSSSTLDAMRRARETARRRLQR